MLSKILFAIICCLSLSRGFAGDRIEPCAFLGSEMTSFEIPTGISAIGEGAFAGSSLRAIVIPEGVVSIGDYAFSGCSDLAEVTLPSSLRAIGKGAFKGCEGLVALSFPDGIEIVGDEAFCKTGLREFAPGAGSRLFTVGALAFSCCKSLTEVVFPDALSSMGSAVLWDCPSLMSVSLPGALRELPELMLVSDTGVSELTLPAELREIGEAAMDGCSGLKRINAVGLDVAPSLGSDIWHGVDASAVNLHVSATAESSFLNDVQWSRFNVISGTTSTTGDSAVCDRIARLEVKLNGERVEVNAVERIKTLKIYTLDGRLLLSCHGTGDTVMSVALPAGKAMGALLFSASLYSGRQVTTKVLLN